MIKQANLLPDELMVLLDKYGRCKYDEGTCLFDSRSESQDAEQKSAAAKQKLHAFLIEWNPEPMAHAVAESSNETEN